MFWLNIDFHIHTKKYSRDSIIDPVELVTKAEEMDLDAIAITEHNHHWSKEEVDNLQNKTKVLVFSGNEVRTNLGDLIVFGYDKKFEYGYDAHRLIEETHENNGIVIAAHPFKIGTSLGQKIYELDVDAIEAFDNYNSMKSEEMAKEAAERLNKPLIGSSDAHKIEQFGYKYTHIDKKINDLYELIQIIKSKEGINPVKRTLI